MDLREILDSSISKELIIITYDYIYDLKLQFCFCMQALDYELVP